MKNILFIVLLIPIFIQCEKRINYYQGYLYDTNNNPIENLVVYEKYNKKSFSRTNKKGLFKIKVKNRLCHFLIIEQNGTTTIDSIQIIGVQGGEKIKYSFINGRNDTLFIDMSRFK
ncbi:hypothetical protein [Tenacibaculum ascidiaceicola]|uniref:hypothetical protein n=1 Tax=Tenacibaculum ascidiaceicola TaxID=1699411 RepID=UPI003894838A